MGSTPITQIMATHKLKPPLDSLWALHEEYVEMKTVAEWLGYWTLGPGRIKIYLSSATIQNQGEGIF